ncbi:hypothetical protein [Acinetobacter sp.]|uniref:hypothetical protein n=1 Tax=Acinetobacter sp. TaxID=472 RepID=UPI000C5CE49F|nr:hypothetical protein [Acinetobacter sp.]MBC68536.1 hypothetical protein [Acinetobacter sp.]MBT50573.1 hypothetical protein [Acinetobacter sp.]|tara:strand:+ start:317 stop:580 length:264 start_codon:yes stop_codon:yes gene_type:complete
MFKVGDYIFTNDDVAHYPYLIIAKKGEHYKLRSENGIRYCREWRIDRIATEQEIAAGHRIDLETLRDCDTSPNCKKFDERVGNNETN